MRAVSGKKSRKMSNAPKINSEATIARASNSTLISVPRCLYRSSFSKNSKGIILRAPDAMNRSPKSVLMTIERMLFIDKKKKPPTQGTAA